MGTKLTTEKLKDMDYDEAKDFIIMNRVHYYGSHHRITYLVKAGFSDTLSSYRPDRLKVEVNSQNIITGINGVG